MQIRIFGFGVDAKEFPQKVSFLEMITALEERSGVQSGKKKLIHAGAAPVNIRFDGVNEVWHAGLIFRTRDAKSYNQLIEEGGELVLKAKQLEGGTKLAELCYFLVNSTTGKGLIACYHGGPGIPVLEQVLQSALRAARTPLQKDALSEVGSDRSKREAVVEAFKGNVKLTHLIKSGTLKDLFKELKKVTDLQLRFSSVESTSGHFTKMKSKALTEKITLKFPEDFEFDDELMKEFINDVDDADVIEAKLIGRDSKGDRKFISSEIARNKMVFDAKDYDDLLGDFTLQLKDWQGTVISSPVVTWLKSLTRDPNTRLLLLK